MQAETTVKTYAKPRDYERDARAMAAAGWYPVGQISQRRSGIGWPRLILCLVASLFFLLPGVILVILFWVGRGTDLTVTYQRQTQQNAPAAVGEGA